MNFNGMLTKNDISDGLFCRLKFLREEIAPDLLKNGHFDKLRGTVEKMQLLERLLEVVKKLPDENAMDVDAFQSLVTQSFSGCETFFVYDKDAGLSFHPTAEVAKLVAAGRMETYTDYWNECGQWGNADTLCWGIALGWAKEESINDGKGGDTQFYSLITP